ncbi:zinc/manganese transport system substrate-binding protein [Jatrophihabitans endophyticus]|uniref:Zinc/manganese transport system substrate-binding protein n=1 Tax=Jatrophihabitans endophyticus TaxID=1206085 RepID=A0A1M5EFB2_9ACTN|nr:zinc ABC transporter substrate-binding protein [Jatrophihabitans endophyticus]SHF77876.1 zinc/manganese transport system substrate-binding protein [Jatrophihabitans endophyticus]
MKSRRALWSMASLVAITAAALAGCGSSSDDAGGSGGSPGTGATGGDSAVRVVASTNVYGDIVAQIGGDKVQVTSIIADPDQDPHSYEADSRTQLALSKADLVVENGGGYDDFVDRMLSSAGASPTTLNVVKLSGKTAPAGGELNEHVWYDFPTVRKLAAKLAVDLSKEDPAGAAVFEANAATLTKKLTTLEAGEAAVRSAHPGAGVAITEPVPLYLLSACGLVNKTPAEFSEAIEEGEGVPVRVLDQTLRLFTSKAVDLLAYNEQTSGPETEKVLAAAKENGVAVVPVTETLPNGKDYIGWMTANLDAVKAALS